MSRPGLTAELIGLLSGRMHLSGLTIEFDQENGRGIPRILVVSEEVIDGIDRDVVHDLHASGQQPSGGDGAHGFTGCSHRGEISQQHVDALRSAQKPQRDGCGDPQGAFTADEGTAQIQLR